MYVSRSVGRFALASLLMLGAATSALAFNESPMLSGLVSAGKLPPVDQRLPKAPPVMDVFGEVGKLDYLLKRFSLESTDIAAAAKRVIARKKA